MKMRQIIDMINNYLQMVFPIESVPLYIRIVKYIQEITGKVDYQNSVLRIYSCMKSSIKNIVGLRIVIDKCREDDNCEPLLILEDLGFIIDNIVNDNECDYFYTFILWIPDIVNTYLKEININNLADKVRTAVEDLSNIKDELNRIQDELKKSKILNSKQSRLYDLINTNFKQIHEQIMTHISSKLDQQVIILEEQVEYLNHLIEPQKLIENLFNYKNKGLDKKEILSRMLDSIIKKYAYIYDKYNKLIRQVDDLSHIVFLLRILIDNYLDPEGFIKLKQELETVYQLIYTLNPLIYPDEYLSRSISTLIFEELKDKLRTMYINADTRHQLISLIDRLSTNLINIIKESIEYQTTEVYY